MCALFFVEMNTHHYFHCFRIFTGCDFPSASSSSYVSWPTATCTAQRLADSLQLTADGHAGGRLRSVDAVTLKVPPMRRFTLGDRAFPLASARAWNSVRIATRAADSVLQFRRDKNKRKAKHICSDSFCRLTGNRCCVSQTADSHVDIVA